VSLAEYQRGSRMIWARRNGEGALPDRHDRAEVAADRALQRLLGQTLRDELNQNGTW